MILYIQDENYHFDGFVSGVIVDNQRTAIFSKNGIEDFNLDIDQIYQNVCEIGCFLGRK